jgi:hypothetical protein
LSFSNQLSIILLVFLFSVSVFAAGNCTVNGVATECSQAVNDYSWVIFLIFGIIFLAVIAFVAYSFFKAWSTGSVSISLSKTSFAPSETISGLMMINLKKAVEVSSAVVEIQGEKTRNVIRNGRRTTETETFYQTEALIQTQLAYQVGSAQEGFSIKIPEDILNKGKFDASGMGAIGGAINFIQDVTQPKPKWYLSVELKTKGNVQLSDRTSIQIN